MRLHVCVPWDDYSIVDSYHLGIVMYVVFVNSFRVYFQEKKLFLNSLLKWEDSNIAFQFNSTIQKEFRRESECIKERKKLNFAVDMRKSVYINFHPA